MATTYKGFSTQAGSKNFRLTDFNLIKQDILNHFNIRKGEKLMNPDFGTIIWDLLYEPLTESLKHAIEQDIRDVLSSDPRISPLAVQVAEKDYGILLEITMTYSNVNQTDTIKLQFDKEIGLVAR